MRKICSEKFQQLFTNANHIPLRLWYRKENLKSDSGDVPSSPLGTEPRDQEPSKFSLMILKSREVKWRADDQPTPSDVSVNTTGSSTASAATGDICTDVSVPLTPGEEKKTANTVRAQTHSCTKFHTVVGATLKLDIYCMLFQGVFPLLCKLVAGVQHKCRGKEQKRWELCGWVFLPAANCLVWKLWKWCKRLVIYKYQSESLSSRTLGIISKVTDISHNSTKNEFSDKITALHCRND